MSNDLRPYLPLLFLFSVFSALSVVISITVAVIAVLAGWDTQDRYVKLAAAVGSGPSMLTALIALAAHGFKDHIARFLEKP